VFSPVQSKEAPLAIEVTVDDIVTEVKPLQPLKAELPIEVTDEGNITDVRLVFPVYVFW
jgi:hypothetical protein